MPYATLPTLPVWQQRLCTDGLACRGVYLKPWLPNK